ncbi:MAG: alpha/beta fold hydrolase [Candidatus Heimdallarchaeota archaeon]
MTILLEYDNITPDPNVASAPYLVFIHGAGEDKTQWNYQIPFFLQIGWGILALSLPGHGGSPDISSTSILEYAKIVYEIITSLNLRNVTLVGRSMGGAVSMQIILSYKAFCIKRAVLIATGAKLRVAPLFFDLISEDFENYRRVSVEYMFDKDATPEIKERYDKELERNGKEILVKDFKACDQFDVLLKLQQIQIPSLIICGENDKMTPLKYSRYLRENLGGKSRLEIISNAGHYVHQSAFKVVNQLIYEFHHENVNS